MKHSIIILLLVLLLSCSESEQDNSVDVDKPITKTETKPTKNLEGYQEALKKAKDLEKDVLKAAEKQKKLIDDLDG